MEEGSESFIARRTESLDARSIESLVNKSTETVFGRTNVDYIIERANLAISLAGAETGEVLAHVSLLDYPAVTSVDPARWEEWMTESFSQDIRPSPVNCLFLHLFVAKEGYQKAAISESLRVAFVAVPLLQYVLLTTTPGTNLGSALLSHFSSVAVKEGVSPSHHVLVTHRHQHFPVLHVRTARVEDAEDLMPIFKQYTHEVAEDYGEYFLAELIDSQDSEHRTLVAEVGGRAVGFISVTTQVDVDLLSSCSHLEPYHGLRHASQEVQSQGSGLMSHSVYSLPGNDPAGQSTASLGDDQAESPLHQTPSQQPAVASSSSLAKASTSSLTRLAHIAQMTSSRSRLTQSKSKLATTSHSMGSQSKAKLTGSRTAVTQSKTTATQSKTTVAESKTKVAESKSKLTESKTAVTQSKTTLDQSQSTAEPTASHTEATRSQSQVRAGQSQSQSQVRAGQSQSQVKAGQSQSQVRAGQSQSQVRAGQSQSQSQVRAGQSQSSVARSEEEEDTRPSPSKESRSRLEEEPGSSSSAVLARGEVGKSSGDKPPEEKRSSRLAGQASAVAIQLFAIDERYEMRSIDLLPAVFKSFPDHDFCVLTLPHTVPEFPLLSHFTRVPPHVRSTLSQELYVFHRCSLLHSFVVRPVVTSDLQPIEQLVGELEGSECVVGDVRRFVEGRRDSVREGATPISAVVAECVGQVVGVAVVRREEELLYIRSHYNIEDFLFLSHHRPSEHSRLHHLLLSPAFTPYTKHFLKELLRLSHMTSLYYPLHPHLLPSSPSTTKPHTLTAAITEMVPVRARRQVVYPQEQLGVNSPLAEVLRERDPFSFLHINRKLTLEPKIVINSRIVLVGASDTGLSFLESLVFSPHLLFNNLVLISPHGLPSSSSSSPSSSSSSSTSSLDTSRPHSCCYWPRSLSLMNLGVWVSVVPARMVALHRPEQQVVVRGEGGEEGVVPYDHLVLCTGLQFDLPPQLEQGEDPIVYDANEQGVVEWVEENIQPGEKLLIHGSSLEAYTSLQALLTHGVAPELISFVQPRPPAICRNSTVELWVQRSLEEVGVAIYTGYGIHSMKEGGVYFIRRKEEEEEEEEGEEGEEEGRGKEREEDYLFIKCKGVIPLDEKHVDSRIFTAVNDACLVFDRRLVVDRHYHTNDPLILAAGPLTKFSRQYHAEQWTPASFNSVEVGQKLAATLLSQLDPTMEGGDGPETESDPLLLPTYSQPKSVYAVLPGGLHYLHIEKPAPTDRSQHTTYSSLDHVLETDTESGYFMVHVDQYSRVQTITVLSHQPFEVTNYQCLYGVHEKYLNNLLSQYDEGLISDFFDYFREPWASAIFHDRFPDLIEEVREHLSEPADGEKESTEQRVRRLLSEQQTVSLEGHKERLLSEFESSPVRAATQQRLHRYLNYNHHHLPMYAQPDII